MSEALPLLPPTADGSDPSAQPMDKLKAERVELKLQQMPEWRLQRGGSALVRRFRFGTPGAGLAFAGLVTSLAERAGRQPRLVLQGNEVHVSLSSPGGVTRADLALARRIHDQI